MELKLVAKIQLNNGVGTKGLQSDPLPILSNGRQGIPSTLTSMSLKPLSTRNSNSLSSRQNGKVLSSQ